MSKLLINENPVMVCPTLAVKLGLNEAMVLQQIHYWLITSSHEIAGRKWIYNTYKEWQNQLPFWSESTIKRAIKSLEKRGYLLAANFNQSKMDKTKWYSINYTKLKELENDVVFQDEMSSNHEELSNMSNCPMEESPLTKAIPEITSKTNTENNIPYVEIIEYLNLKTKTTYKPTTKKTRELIDTRWREGFILDDFKKVIDLKYSDWGNDPHWCKFLRPETLFGPKFESYLNQKPKKVKWNEEDFDLDD